MRYLSLFSGIEAATVAWEPLGWTPVAFAEIDPFASAVLAHHWPNVPNLGDVSGITPAMLRDLGPVDIVVGGFPCQDLSVAGLRAGFEGVRSSLFFEMVRIVHESRPALFLWENVPGLLSSNRGRDFGAVLMAMDRLGFDGAWTSLDAQYFGVAQRRQRVFGVFARRDIGAARCAEILAFPARLSGHTPPRRETGQDVAGTLTGGTQTGRSHGKRNGSDRVTLVPEVSGTRGFRSGEGGFRNDLDSQGAYVPFRAHSGNAHEGRNEPTSETLVPMVAAPITASYARHYGRTAGNNGGVDNMIAYIAYACQGTNVGEMGALRQGNGHVTGGVPFVASALRADGFDASEDGTGRQNLIAFDLAQITSAANRTRVAPDLPASTLNGGGAMHVASPMAVRRLTPRECERLQGFPDDHTLVLYRGKLAADGPRYKAIGNSMAVPVMRWIGERIATVLEAT